MLYTNYGDIGNTADYMDNGHLLLVCGRLITTFTVTLLVPLKAAFVQVMPVYTGWDIVLSDTV